MDSNQNNGRQPARPQGQRPVRPQNQGQAPVRPQMQGQRPVRPQMQGQRPVRPQVQGREYEQSPSHRQQVMREHEQSPSRRQQVMREHEQSSSHRQPMVEHEQNYSQYTDNNFEDFNSAVVTDTVAENKARGKKVKKVKVKKEVTPEQKKKRLIILGIVFGVIVVAIIGFIVVSKLLEKNSQHINVATNETQQNVQQEVNQEDNQQETNNQQSEVEETEVSEPIKSIEARECSESNPLDIGEYSSFDLIVNTKAEGDTQYTDKEAKVYVRMSNVVSGYDEASKYIEQYNDTNLQNKKITLPSSDDYYSLSNSTEMVMLEFELLYPDDFPTSASGGVVYRIPNASISVYGTLDEIDSDEITQQEGYNPHDYIVVDDVIYKISKLTDISVYELNTDKGIKVGEPIYFRYIISLPVGATSDVYAMKLDVDLDTEDPGKDASTFWFKGQQIEQSDTLTEFISKQEENGNTENTEENNTEEESVSADENGNENLDEQSENNE